MNVTGEYTWAQSSSENSNHFADEFQRDSTFMFSRYSTSGANHFLSCESVDISGFH